MARAGERDTAWLLALTGVLFLWYLAPFALKDLHFPLGPDGPVYLWWSRLAGHDGLSAVARPGVPAVALTLAGAFHLPLTAVTAGLEVSLGVALGLSAWALARDGGAERWTAFAAGLLAGTFGVHLASGYLATLAFAVGFVAALVALGREDRRATAGAAFALVAATLSHPLFALLALAILVAIAGLSWRAERRDEVARVATAVLGAGAVSAIAFLALGIGPGPLAVDTSRDGFLRRAGLGDVLRDAYLDRFLHRWTRYVQWLSLPLAAIGWRRSSGFARRALVAWTLVTVAGVAISLLTRWFPPDRFITFGFAIPILAAFGLAALATWLHRRSAWLARAVPAAALVAMLAGAGISWARQEPFLDQREVAQVTAAARVAHAEPTSRPLAFVVDEPGETISFLATRAANVIRAAIGPERIRDVVVVVQPSDPMSAERAALAEITHADLRRASRIDGTQRGFALRAFVPYEPELVRNGSLGEAGSWIEIGPGVATGSPAPPGADIEEPLEPASTGEIPLASAVALLALWISGRGWARAFRLERATAIATAPAFGYAAFAVVGVALERLGVPLTGAVGPTIVALVSAIGGFALGFVLDRRARSRAAPQVEQQPAE